MCAAAFKKRLRSGQRAADVETEYEVIIGEAR